ncbi:MAG: hypothetical protein IT236_17915 [Bacteroidia bacterium]|nr:hypothetical protein [Bacteroidia bacterium]
MNIKISKISIETQALTPTLTIWAELEFQREIEIPLSISGRMLSNDGKLLSLLNEYQVHTDTYYELTILSRPAKDKLYRQKNETRYQAQMTAVLNHMALDWIERLREKDHEKSVRFSFDFIVKTMEIPAEPDRLGTNDSFLKLQIKRLFTNEIIKQSDWVNNYAPSLGIGKFLMLELKMPTHINVSKFWSDLYQQLCLNLNDMETSLRSGDWEKTMLHARKFYENIKIGDNKPGNKKFKDEFDKIMGNDLHTKDGIQNLYDALWKLFEFMSKYIHEKDKAGNIQPAPVSKKEDAYLAFTLGVGLLNMIGRKIAQS